MLCQAILEPEIKRKVVSPYTCFMCFLTSFLQNMRVIEKIKSMYNNTALKLIQEIYLLIKFIHIKLVTFTHFN